MITALIPARNEEATIYQIIKATSRYSDEVVVVDDASTDSTARVAARAGAKVVVNPYRMGYIGAIKTGFKAAGGDIIVTIDADGEHDPRDIPRLVKPISEGRANLVLGKREKVGRVSEQFINWMTRKRMSKYGISDSCTGFRAIEKGLALQLQLEGLCTCGTLALEADSYGAIIAEVPVATIHVDKPRKVAWYHVKQILYVNRLLARR